MYLASDLVVVVAPIATIVGVVVGAYLGAYLPYLLEQRQAARARYDAAISAVTVLQAHRHGSGVNIPSDFIKPAEPNAMAKVSQDLSVEGVRRFLDAAAASRAALAALHPYSSDLKQYWDKFEVSEAEADRLIDTLIERRKSPLRRHHDPDGYERQ